MSTIHALLNDEAGFLISAELVLIATIAVLALVVGLSEMAGAVNNELNDLAEAFGSFNQSFAFSGFLVCKPNCFTDTFFSGSSFTDFQDVCDGNECDISCAEPVPEFPKNGVVDVD